MKYLILICSTIAILACLWAYVLDSRLTTAKKELALSNAEKTALETEVKNYNEKSLQASKQIRELRGLVEKHSSDSEISYACLNIRIPDDVLRLLYEE